MTLQHEIRSATVTVPDDQVSLAIGKNGQNVRLASKLTGYSLTLVKEGAEDIDLAEFKEDISPDIYEKLVDYGIETARELLETDPEQLLSIDGITPERLIDLRSIILSEFDEEESEDLIEKINEYKTQNPASDEIINEENNENDEKKVEND